MNASPDSRSELKAIRFRDSADSKRDNFLPAESIEQIAGGKFLLVCALLKSSHADE